MLRTTASAFMWLCLLSAPPSAEAQSTSGPVTATAPARFEVASVRPSRPDAPAQTRYNLTANRLDIEGFTIGDILDLFHHYQYYRVVGGPDWMRTDRYDIHASTSTPIPETQQGDALFALLGERFQLITHRETREISAIVLTAPKPPAGLKPAAAGELPNAHGDHGNFVYSAVSIGAISTVLSQRWQMPVVDLTGITGKFDFTLALSATDSHEPLEVRVNDAVTALGFKVETKKMPIEVTVVDHLEHPSEN